MIEKTAIDRVTARRTLLAAALAQAAHAQGEKPMTVLPLQPKLDPGGKDKQVEPLFTGPRRKLVQITLRNNAILDRHTAPVPITIQCISGAGTLTAGDPAVSVALSPGILVTLEPNVAHEIRSAPAVSILLTQFV